MIVIRTGKPIRKVFLKTGEVLETAGEEFHEDDFSGAESYATLEGPDEEAVNRLVEERLAEARAQWQAETEQARQEALESGRQEGALETEARLAERAKVIEGLLGALADERESVLREAESLVLDLVFKIARRFVGTAAEVGSDVIKQSIKSALRLVTEKEKLVLRVHPEDLDEVRDHQGDIIFIGDGIGRLDVRPDKQVRRGGCVIETDAGNIDARIETRLVEIEKALRQAYYTGGSRKEEREDAPEDAQPD